MNEEWSQVAANAISHAAEMAVVNIQVAANAISHAAEMAVVNIQVAASEFNRPSVMYRPSLALDGNQWCALYGENLQDGVAGFGDSPEKAMRDFDRNWYKETP